MTSSIFERTLITGGTGFIGSNLISELLTINCSPTVLTRDKQETTASELQQKKTTLIELDITDYSAVKNFILNFRPTLIINLAATHGRDVASGQTIYKVNYEAVENLLKASAEAKVEKVILFGSADEYGYQPIPQSENMSLLPNSEYAASKARMTRFARKMYQDSGLPVVVLRPFTVYGMNQPKGMFLSDAIGCALKHLPFEMSEGRQKRDYIFISDFVRAIMQASRTPNIEGEVFNIGSGQAFPLREIAEKVWEITGAEKSLLKIGARTAQRSELHDTCADIAKAKTLLDWQPEVALEDGLRETIKSIKQNTGDRNVCSPS
jgi:nucleoside-diphosphate-sugar epimerase